ncbi:MAG TPA: IS110 family transposase [Tepidisphaeraceae bacterium]|jgi:transposase|nr:IS110 family transposase [Tepidisphaeraceae bacterium]
MSPADMHDLLARHVTAPDPSDTLVCFETCDTAGWVHDVCAALGTATTVVNANDERWRWRRVKRKTDRDDALKLARLALLDQLGSVHMPAPDARQRRRLMLHRRSVVSRRTQSRNAVRAIFNQQGLSLARGGKQWTLAGVAQLREHARPIAACADVMDLWRGRLAVELDLIAATDAQLKLLDDKLDELANLDARTQLLRTFKGVGPRLSEAVVLYLDDARRFKSVAEVASYAGLVPKQIESGQMSRNGHITGRGPGLLRSLLVEAAWTVYRCHDWARAWVDKVSRGAKGPDHLLGHAQDEHAVPRADDDDADTRDDDARARMTTTGPVTGDSCFAPRRARRAYGPDDRD